MINKKVLVLYAFNNSGHQAAADSLREALKDIHSDWEIQTLNVLEYLGPNYEKIVSFFYKLLSLKLPWLWKWLYNNFHFLKTFARLREYGYQLAANRLKCLANQFDYSRII